VTELEYFKQWAADRYPNMPQDTMEQNGQAFFYHDMLQMAWKAFQYRYTIRPTSTMENGKFNKAEFRKDNAETIVDRLRGIYPQIDPPYRTSLVMQEAAREIERLREQVKRLTPVYLKPSEYPPLFSHDMYE
jgi:hypothetical protein